jgi:hypothetical protein
MTSYVHTVFPGDRTSFFDDDNKLFIQSKIEETLSLEFRQEVMIDIASIVRVMERVYGERRETVPKMNQRVVMYICNEFRNHQLQANKNLKWEAHFVESQQLFDSSTQRGPDLQKLKITDTLFRPKVGGTLRYYFT